MKAIWLTWRGERMFRCFVDEKPDGDELAAEEFFATTSRALPAEVRSAAKLMVSMAELAKTLRDRKRGPDER